MTPARERGEKNIQSLRGEREREAEAEAERERERGREVEGGASPKLVHLPKSQKATCQEMYFYRNTKTLLFLSFTEIK